MWKTPHPPIDPPRGARNRRHQRCNIRQASLGGFSSTRIGPCRPPPGPHPDEAAPTAHWHSHRSRRSPPPAAQSPAGIANNTRARPVHSPHTAADPNPWSSSETDSWTPRARAPARPRASPSRYPQAAHSRSRRRARHRGQASAASTAGRKELSADSIFRRTVVDS